MKSVVDRAALEAIVDSLPLTDKQRELARETIADISPEEAEELIEHHKKLISALPQALAALRNTKIHRKKS